MTRDEAFHKLEEALKVVARKRYELELAEATAKIAREQVKFLRKAVETIQLEPEPAVASKSEYDEFMRKYGHLLSPEDEVLLEKRSRPPDEIYELWDASPRTPEIRKRLNGTSTTGIKYKPGRGDLPRKRMVCVLSVLRAWFDGETKTE